MTVQAQPLQPNRPNSPRRRRERPQSFAQSLLTRLNNTRTTYFQLGDWLIVLVCIGLLLMPALMLNEAGWPLNLNTLVPVVGLSVIFGFLLSRTRYDELFGLLMGAIYGQCFVILIAALNEPGGVGQGIQTVVSRTVQWLFDAVNGGVNQDEMVFTLLMGGLFWLLGFNLSWHIFRVSRVWRAILPPALIMVTNAISYNGITRLEPYFIVYVFLALILVVRVHLDAREWDWRSTGVRVPKRLRAQVFIIGAILAMIVLSAWLVPTRDVEERLNRFQEFMASEPMQQLSELWNRLFTSIDTQGPATSDYYGGDSLQLGGAIRLGDQVALVVNAPDDRRYYWRSRVFDSYNMGRWTSAADTRLTDPEAPLAITQDPGGSAARVEVRQQVTLGLSASRLVYTAPQPVSIDLATRSDLRYTPDQAMSVSVVRPMRILNEGDSYTAVSAMTVATAEQLQNAGTNYPQWILDTYPNYVPSATGRTVQLARTIVDNAGAVTPFDRARAIESWLRENIVYDEAIPQPPLNQDPVDWLLFDLQRGYCNYYASSMIVMLRSLGVPARMAAGFAQGEWDATLNGFVVRERDAHTWVEVYFPGYGWVEFEPTAAQAIVDRGDQLPQPGEDTPPTQTPAPTDTPLPSPTPSLTPTPPATATPFNAATATGEGQSAAPPPTVTLTFTPSPTATPVIVPTQPPPLMPRPRDPLSFLIPALSAGLAILLGVFILLGVIFFIYWYWEWRGMRGMNPVLRAYARLERYLPLVGVRFEPEQTPYERRQQVVERLPKVEPPVTAITSLYLSERYGKPPEDTADERRDVADRAWTDARGGILRRWLRKVFAPWRRE